MVAPRRQANPLLGGRRWLSTRCQTIMLVVSAVASVNFPPVYCRSEQPHGKSTLVPNAPQIRNNHLSDLKVIRGGQQSRASDQDVRPQSSATVEGLKNSLASSLASFCAKSLLQPFDTIKTMQQQVRSDVASGPGHALGLVEAARMIIERDGGAGFWELYAGLGVSAVGSMPSIGLYYGVYSYCKRIFIPLIQSTYGSDAKKQVLSDEALKLIGVAVAAALGNTLASFSRVPYEVVKQKLQTGQFTNTLTAITSMFGEQGWRAFFPLGGVSIQMIRDIPYAIFTLLTYEALRDHWVDRAEAQSPWRDMVAGAAAGGLGALLTNPFDVVKTRVQTDADLYGGSAAKCARATFEEGGAGAFMRGSVPRLMHKIPANGFFFVFFEMFRRALKVDGASTKANNKSSAAAERKR